MLMHSAPVPVPLLCLKHRREADGQIVSEKNIGGCLFREHEWGDGWSTCMQLEGHAGDCLFVANRFIEWRPLTEKGAS